MRFIRSRLFYTILGFTAALCLTAAIDDSMQRMLRGHELIASIYQKILEEYVEEVSPDDLLQGGVKGMLGQLDPYAELIEERENSEVDMLSRGTYSGLGIKVKKRDGRHIVSYIYDQIRPLTNLRLGDILLRIDTIDLRTNDLDDLRTMLRGQPGTSLRLLVQRPGVFDSLSLTVMRRNILIDPLPYNCILGDKIFYMKLTRFSRTAADSVQIALQRVYAQGNVRGIIIDVRDNPGGLLESAVALVNKFVPSGTPIVTMKGRQPDYTREYFAKVEPIDARVPIAVLVNEHSASAAEIVAGALQDLDRAVIIGQRTFGKGLVQTLIPLSYNAYLKLTTSRYFIPSGRCIQRLRYANGKPARVSGDAADEPVFRSLRLARALRESNGIVPDIVFKKDSLSPLLACLEKHDAVFTFVALYINRFKPGRVPEVDGPLREMFKRYSDSLSACDDNKFSGALSTLRSEAIHQGMTPRGFKRIKEIESEIRKLHSVQFDRQWGEIRALLSDEFTLQVLGEPALTKKTVAKDKMIERAMKLLEVDGAWEAALLSGLSY
ncbi:MAG: S41 family peptidase [Bacteroidota bacterium]|jgi:carboxyl-terminal processing protease